MTNVLVAFFAGTLVGAVVGVFAAALMTAAGDSEIKREKEYQEFIKQRGENMGEEKKEEVSETMSTEELKDYIDELEDRIKNGRF